MSSELALVVMLLFVLAIGLTLMWMWSRLEIRDIQEAHADEIEALEAELEEVYGRYAEWMARAVSNDTRVAWLTSYMNRTYSQLADVQQELELERIVSDAYAAGIERQER